MSVGYTCYMAKKKTKAVETEPVTPPPAMPDPVPQAPTPKAGALRNRVIERRRMLGSQLTPNEKNWRIHTKEQTAALNEILTTIGMAGELLAYTSERNGGKLTTINGHLRSETWADEIWDVAITDLSDAEADKLLAAMDPIGAAADVDQKKLQALLLEIDTESDALEAILNDAAGVKAPKDSSEEVAVDLKYHVLIDCEGEDEQLIILKELDRCGIDSKAICAGFPKVEKKEPGPAPKVESTGRKIVRSTPIARTPRVKQLEGMFDVPPSKRSAHEWVVDFHLDKPWQIGLIVGPSGSGKTTLAHELFDKQLVTGWPWPEDGAIVDGFPEGMSIHDITGLLSSVGFSSPPSWLKPYHVLSNGEQFRVTLARTLAEAPELAVMDEFTSVVDRTVAQIGSAALAKTIRGTGRRFVAVACHYDIEEWLQPDWKYDTASGQFLWRSLRRRPEIQLQIRRVGTSWWKIFAGHHYLSHTLHRSAKCFLAEINGRPAAFASVIHNPHKGSGWWRELRTVCLPDFQGIGLGNALSEFVAGVMRATGKDYRSTTSHPAMIRHRCKSPLWSLRRAPEFGAPPNAGAFKGDGASYQTVSWNRPTAGFQFIGPANPDAAKSFGII